MGATQRDAVSARRVRTNTTSARIPPGLMKSGEIYVLRIAAMSASGWDVEKDIEYSGETSAFATVLSGVMHVK